MAKVEAIGSQNLSVKVKKTIQSIKEIVGNHSDADIYSALQESNMDPNETTQKLLNQDPFHEVRRRRDKKKEIQNEGLMSSTTPEPRQNFEQVGQERKSNLRQNQNVRRSGSSRTSGVSHQFRVVRDNRVNQNKETDVAVSPTPTNDPASSVPVNSSLVGTSSNQKPPVGHRLSQRRNGPSHLQPRQSREANLVGTGKKVLSEDKLAPLPDSSTRLHNAKTNNTHLHSTASSSSSAVGVYSSSSDPVHVPSRDSRQAANVGAIKREVGVVGARRQSSESVKLSSTSSNLLTNRSQNVLPESTAPAPSGGRSVSNNHYSSRAHQTVGHPKAPQPSKAWKPKLNKKAATSSVGVIGSPTKAGLPSDNSNNVETEATQLKDKHTPMHASENQNVIIAAHIRVSESDRYRLTFGSLGAEFETASSGNKAAGIAEVATPDHSVSVPMPDPVPSGGEAAQKAELIVDRIQSSDSSNSSVSAPLSKPELADKKVSSSSQNVENYGDIGLIRDSNLAYNVSETRQQVVSELPSFSAYDQTGYNIPYSRPPADEAYRRQGLLSPQEALSSHTANSIPATTMALSQQQQQQQQQLAQMYPQLHFMPYRQVFPPFYVPPMAMPGYSSNPAYPHPSNGSSYVLMPGGSSHLAAGSVKYGMQQFKPSVSPTGFGNYSSPTGYAINSSGVVGGGTGLEDASRLKYKDSNLYVPNAQADSPEMWMNTKEIPGMQSASYYNMPGQTPHAAAYLPSHTGHASYNAAAAAAQSSHMQFPAMYHSPQSGTIASPHPLGPAMVGNIGATATSPLPQVGGYQQPQMGHLNWAGNLYEYS